MRCQFCPRYCRVDRGSGGIGFCEAGRYPTVSMADLHFWEEPCVSGDKGSGTVFFTRCNLRCVFCQNHKISQGPIAGSEMTPQNLARTFLSLQERGAHNVNLVSPTHFVGPVALAMREARELGLSIPFVYNTNAYDSEEGLTLIDGLVDIFLPDLKYASSELSGRYSAVPDYFERASRAILEMARQVGEPQFDSRGVMTRGLIVRHLVLPGCVDDSITLLRWIRDNLPKGTFVSVMSQYYPCHKTHLYPEIDRRLSQAEYDRVLEEVYLLGLEGYVQDLESASSDYTPDFDRKRPT